MPPLRTLVVPKHEPLIIVEKRLAYAERYDFIGAINGSQAIAGMTLTPSDRKGKDIAGVRREIVNEWILNTLAPAINRLCIENFYLICDKSRADNKRDMIEALNAAGCRSVIDVCYMLTASAKYVSPLDNPIGDSFKETIRSQHPLTTANLLSTLSKTFFYC